MKEYNCPHCERTFCTGCIRIKEIPQVTNISLDRNAYVGLEKVDVNVIYFMCRKCDNHPRNGGLGLCQCIFGVYRELEEETRI